MSDFSNPFLRSFGSFWLSFANKITAGTYNFVTLILKIKLLGLTLVLSPAVAVKTLWPLRA